MSINIHELKQRFEALSPGARLLIASQLVAKGNEADPSSYDLVELGITMAETVAREWRAAQLLARRPR